MTSIQSKPILTEHPQDEVDPAELKFQTLKVSLHEQLVESLELSLLAQGNQKELLNQVQTAAEIICQQAQIQQQNLNQERMISELIDEVFGLGPLEPLMNDPHITDILVNHAHEIYIERFGQLELSSIIFADNKHLTRIIQRIVSQVGRRIDETSPLVDARLSDGSRINAVIPPLALNGPTLSIRRFGNAPLTIDNLIQSQSITPQMVDFLAAAITARISFLISGGTGAGKTTLLNCLASFIPAEERIVTIEDSAELNLQHRHVVRMETRPANTEGIGEVSPRTLVKNSLRMRPDRILIGEVRGSEALDMLQAMNTGHEGSLTTIHANDSRDALSRLEMMVAMSGYELPVNVIRNYVISGIGLVIHVSRLKGGLRRVMKISEIVSVDQGHIHVEDIFGFDQTGVDENGVAQGDFYTTGYLPRCVQRFKAAGIHLPLDTFEPKRLSTKPIVNSLSLENTKSQKTPFWIFDFKE